MQKPNKICPDSLRNSKFKNLSFIIEEKKTEVTPFQCIDTVTMEYYEWAGKLLGRAGPCLFIMIITVLYHESRSNFACNKLHQLMRT